MINTFDDSLKIANMLNQVRDPETSPEVLAELSKSDNDDIRYWIPWNANTPTDILLEYADCNDENIIYGLTCCQTARPAVLAKLVNHANETVKYWVAGNTHTPAESLIKLAECGPNYIKNVVAKNPNTPEIVKLWLNNGGYAGLTLVEFIDSVHGKGYNHGLSCQNNSP